MELVLVGIIIMLVSLHFLQLYRVKQRDKQLEYLSKRLKEVGEKASFERILLSTDDKAIQTLLVQVNEFLDRYQQSSAQFKKTEQSIKKMLSNVSHDLKTPLTVVLGYIETIQQDSRRPIEEQTRLLTKIHQKTLEIIHLINSFFDLAKLEADDQTIDVTGVHINEICRKNILSFYDMVQMKKFEAVIDIPDTPIYALANEEALGRILNNLFSNALHHGEAGKTVGFSLEYDEHHVNLSVWDKGKGIEEQHQAHVFERSFTLEESRNKAFQGSGLGLTITKKLVESMGGNIFVESTPFQKTTFLIQLKRISI
ncbi:cell wall metabolism sensor histidine kinase WalK [Sporosarcina sp. Te-1]|uniref:sensor histidine kinase n=1 Tax=Sporosarcina sp. Te-1 TaxID=2818390 RepID=UPI001A9E0292|nr:sensor histidine kinase [Sporosarcina sp. Te-1]QTD40319.1 sensor histidine kinase [Sporosarcina sp. Te-1]